MIFERPAYLNIVVLILILLAALTAGCSLLRGSDLPTPFPDDYVQTAIEMTVQAGELSTSAAILNPSTPEATQIPLPLTPTPDPGSAEAVPTDLESEPTHPSASPTGPTIETLLMDNGTPTPGIPGAAIQIDRPGPMSKIVSTLYLVGYVDTEPGGHMRIELWLEPLSTEDQPRLLLREVQNFAANPTPRIYISKEFSVEISRVSEFAQLRISTFDSQDRIVALASVDLLLLSVGDSELNPPGALEEPIVILEPGQNKLIQGGTVLVSGLVRPSGNQSLSFNMTAPDGRIVGLRQIAVTPSPDGSYVPFSADVPYNVDDPTRVRIAVYENTGRIPGITHLSSIEVFVSP